MSNNIGSIVLYIISFKLMAGVGGLNTHTHTHTHTQAFIHSGICTHARAQRATHDSA